MHTKAIIGLESAWTNRVPGAICSIKSRGGEVTSFEAPRLVRFDEAADYIEEVSNSVELTLVALDQPSLVPNLTGMRPVERVAGSVVNRIKGGVQPAYRGKLSMFGDTAPVWPFLERIGARENPEASRQASHGLFLMEVFPALALPSLIPEIWSRRRAAKYNPAARKTYKSDDWRLVTAGIASMASQSGLHPVASFASSLAQLTRPGKADQDKLDALICLMIGWVWQHHEREQSVVLGDSINGYMVTPASPAVRDVLLKSATEKGVPMDAPWEKDAERSMASAPMAPTKNPPRRERALAKRQARTPLPPNPNGNVCPECGHRFKGIGWGGIDAHWRARHEDIMPYDLAWPIIMSGGRPSSVTP